MYICNACPRKCGVDRENNFGVCGTGTKYKLARAALHFWEEPCISGTNGSGTVFFSGCSLKCVYCQNYEISQGGKGKEITEDRLIEIFKNLEKQGAHNINLVNPTHYAIQLANTLKKYKPSIPVVYNTGGYDDVESLKMLDGLVDIYLTDIKYADGTVAKKYSRAENYFEVASEAVKEMYRQTGDAIFEKDLMKKGLIIRHLILPGNVSQGIKILDWIKENLNGEIVLSLMGQYLPCGEAEKYPTINRRISQREYNMVIDYADKLGFENAYIQDLSSSDKDFIPDFDCNV